MLSLDQTVALEHLHTLRDFLRLAVTEFSRANIFYGHGTDNALDEARYLLFETLHLPYENPTLFSDAVLMPQEKEELLTLIIKRIEQRIPVAYLVNKAYFAGYSFYVDERVLIPRSPIAELIEQQFSPWLNECEVNHILDLCTGSGCIAIATAHAFPEAQVDAVDISNDALAVTQININQHQLGERVTAVQSDLFSALGNKRYDLIVSNPPYVDTQDLSMMPAEFHHEPRLGLAAGEDGLVCVDRILAEVKQHLTPEGILIIEVGNSEEALMEKYPHLPFLWLDFERGGKGVFLLRADQLPTDPKFCGV